jgi:hypothetical protein
MSEYCKINETNAATLGEMVFVIVKSWREDDETMIGEETSSPTSQ